MFTRKNDWGILTPGFQKTNPHGDAMRFAFWFHFQNVLNNLKRKTEISPPMEYGFLVKEISNAPLQKLPGIFWNDHRGN
ncbi:hypothetical protein [Negadavirga shengliensis]|uniref:Uncharacterized protein n=1 Tax=Negadavirga shengliensis TaxID=1389218 RepID=A0ABV9T262_9BACT